MKYMIFPTKRAAETMQRRILKLWSHERFQRGHSKGADDISNTGLLDGKTVPVKNARWSDVQEVVGGWAILSPENHTFEDGVIFSLAVAVKFKAADMRKIGIRNRAKPVGAFTQADILKIPARLLP